MYKTSAITYAIGIRLVQVKWAAMPNILANEEVFPEFLQNRATAQNIAGAALELLGDAARRTKVKSKLAAIVATLGKPGAAGRAAENIIGLFRPHAAASSPEN
jgi:lipid-A-disaccharide synthase